MDLTGLGVRGKVTHHRTFQRHSTAQCDEYRFDSPHLPQIKQTTYANGPMAQARPWFGE